jgi:hypothetical protein
VKHHSRKILKKKQQQRSMRPQNWAKQDFTAVTTTLCEKVLNVMARACVENVAATIPVNLHRGKLFKPSIG